MSLFIEKKKGQLLRIRDLLLMAHTKVDDLSVEEIPLLLLLLCCLVDLCGHHYLKCSTGWSNPNLMMFSFN